MNYYADEVKQFLSWCRPKLGLRGRIRVKLTMREIRHGRQATFGYYDPASKQIVVCIRDRHATGSLR